MRDACTHVESELGLSVESASPINPQASGREYVRVRLSDGGTVVVARDPDPDRRTLFIRRTKTLLRADPGLRVPRLLWHAPDDELYVTDDLGELTVADALRRHRLRGRWDHASTLLKRSGELLARFQAAASESDLPVQGPGAVLWDEQGRRYLLHGLLRFLEDAGDRRVTRDHLKEIEALVRRTDPRRQVRRGIHFDFRPQNLVLATDDPEGDIGIVDVQDALPGVGLYDLAALVGSTSDPLPLEVAEAALEGYLDAGGADLGPEAARHQLLEQIVLRVGQALVRPRTPGAGGRRLQGLQILQRIFRELGDVPHLAGFAPEEARAPEQGVEVRSFSFRTGIPQPGDPKTLVEVVDLRCVPNPYRTPHLRDRVGTDPEVQDAVFGTREAQGILEDTHRTVRRLRAAYPDRPLLLLFGCTGGRHRSVAFAERVGECLGVRPIHLGRAGWPPGAS